ELDPADLGPRHGKLAEPGRHIQGRFHHHHFDRAAVGEPEFERGDDGDGLVFALILVLGAGDERDQNQQGRDEQTAHRGPPAGTKTGRDCTKARLESQSVKPRRDPGSVSSSIVGGKSVHSDFAWNGGRNRHLWSETAISELSNRVLAWSWYSITN